MNHTLVVFSHLRWDYVFQRPQHVLSRLAQHFNVIFFEEPEPDRSEDFLHVSTPAQNVTVCRPHSRRKIAGFHDDHIPVLQRLLHEFMEREAIDDYSLWFYSPMALPLMQKLKPRMVVYDCMDELSAFRNAPRQLLQRENALLKCADLVFTGGPSLFRAKHDRHPSVHCFPSSVDAAHYSRARDRAIDHPLQRDIPGPRLGYFGVIDERIDLELLAQLAAAKPEWQIIMVGPHAKINPDDMPRRANIHYFGQQDYADLPRFLAGWDVCLQPFALCDATRFISPTKTLEYMAADKPIVSTPITDVAAPYGHIVSIAEGADAFIAACERALSESDDEAAKRVQSMRTIIAGTSWDITSARMYALMQPLMNLQPQAGKHAFGGSEMTESSTQISLPSTATTLTPKATANSTTYSTIVLGAGPTGLSAAYHLGKDSLLLERNSTVGGWCRSIEDNGFTFDYAGHIMFSNDAYVHQLYEKLLGDNVHWQQREAWVYSKETYTRYPFQGALHGLPAEVIKECLIGAIEARFGTISSDSHAKSELTSSSASVCKAESITDCCADGIAESTTPLGRIPENIHGKSSEPRNFEEFIYKVWGAGVARHFAVPYNRKLWAVPLSEMETSWLGGRVPLPNLEEMIDGALRPPSKPAGPNARFGYPLRGGFQALMDGFLPLLEGDLRTGADVVQVRPHEHKVVLSDGSSCHYRQLITTVPLPRLILKMMKRDIPATVREAALQLRHVSVRCVNLGIARQNVTEKHWIYYPEESVFHRIFVQGNASPHCNPVGGFGLTCEITYSPSKPLPCDGEELIDLCIADCIRVGMIEPEDRILARNQVDMPYAYVVYDHARKRNVDIIRAWLSSHDILLAGRYSEWEYYNSDHAFLAGKHAAERALSLSETSTSDAQSCL